MQSLQNLCLVLYCLMVCTKLTPKSIPNNPTKQAQKPMFWCKVDTSSYQNAQALLLIDNESKLRKNHTKAKDKLNRFATLLHLPYLADLV